MTEPTTPVPIPLTPELYWRLRAMHLQHQQTVRTSEAALHEAVRAAGLDVTRNYALDDATCSATPAP